MAAPAFRAHAEWLTECEFTGDAPCSGAQPKRHSSACKGVSIEGKKIHLMLKEFTK